MRHYEETCSIETLEALVLCRSRTRNGSVFEIPVELVSTS
jgi:hypothetical protein